MPVPDFTDNGLLPAGIHGCSLAEAEEVLSSNPRRAEIWQGLLRFIDWADPLPPPTSMLIDGSYVTDKPLPGDVDVVVDITECSSEDRQLWFDSWSAQHGFVKDNFLATIYLANTP